MLEPGSGPAHARNGSGSEGRDDAMRAANAEVCGGVVAQSAGWWARVAERYAAIIPAGVVGVFSFQHGR